MTCPWSSEELYIRTCKRICTISLSFSYTLYSRMLCAKSCVSGSLFFLCVKNSWTTTCPHLTSVSTQYFLNHFPDGLEKMCLGEIFCWCKGARIRRCENIPADREKDFVRGWAEFDNWLLNGCKKRDTSRIFFSVRQTY